MRLIRNTYDDVYDNNNIYNDNGNNAYDKKNICDFNLKSCLR